jgi:hypothetical protein
VTIYDSVTAADIPESAGIVAGYKSGGAYTWSAEDWARFPNATRIEIVTSAVNDGDALDVETGDATIAQIAGWVEKRRAAGVLRPWIYVERRRWSEARGAVSGPVGWWIADWTGEPHELDDAGVPADAVQYANPPSSGGHFDVSELYGTLPSEYTPAPEPAPEPAPAPAPAPEPSPEGFDMSTLPELAEGASGDAVKSVQSLLNGKGGAGLVVDGQFGPTTKLKVQEWQDVFHLATDGVVGPQTWASLLLL